MRATTVAAGVSIFFVCLPSGDGTFSFDVFVGLSTSNGVFDSTDWRWAANGSAKRGFRLQETLLIGVLSAPIRLDTDCWSLCPSTDLNICFRCCPRSV